MLRTESYSYEERRDAAERIRSAKVLIRALVALLQREPEILDLHRKAILDTALWKLTEAETRKHRTRFCSKEVWNTPKIQLRDDLRHEHVFQRKEMAERLLLCAPERVDEIIDEAVGCTVTEREHTLLTPFKNFYGWERYYRAGIIVIDAKTGAEKQLH